MSRKFSILFISLLVLSSCDTNKEERWSANQPNILLMIADDMGYGDLGCYGGLSSTPNIDKLAESGIKFTNFYAAAPNCSPSRVGLMTGKSPSKLGMYSYRPPGHPLHLRDEEVTIAEILKTQGYQTAHIGKWHLGCLPQDPKLQHPQPGDQGFDYSLGTENNAEPSHLNPVNFIRNGKAIGEVKGYSCHILADEVESWFDSSYKQEDPFFMYLAFHEPHAKIASPPELVKKYNDYPIKDAEYLANIENLDLAVGRVVDYLEARNLLENTMIVFSSDNGSYRQASNGNLKAVKSFVYEGGVKVPGIINWPLLKRKGEVVHEPVGFVDILPTLCDVLNINPMPVDNLEGTSLLDLLFGRNFVRANPLFWFFYRTSPEIAMRIGDHVILGKDSDTLEVTHRFSAPDMSYINKMKLVDYELYDLSLDTSQITNLYNDHVNARKFKILIDNKLKEIQQDGHDWLQLPDQRGLKKLKKDWVKY